MTGKKERKHRMLIMISLALLGVMYCIPFFQTEGIIAADDATFHVSRLVGLSNVWVSPVNFESFDSNGTMVNIFYPWLTMYPMHILYRIFGSYVTAYRLYYVLLSIATLLIAYLSMRKITESSCGAYIFAVLYAFSSYRYADIFNRGALGEAIALAFLPLVLLGIYRICLGDCGKWAALAAGMTLTAYSHVLSLVMAAAFTGLMYVISLAFQDRRKERLAALLKAAALSFCLSAAMIVPMLQQYINNDLFTPEGNGETLSRSAYSIGEIIHFTVRNNPAGRGVGILSLAAAAGAAVLLIYRHRKDCGTAQEHDRFAALLLAAGLIIVFCTSDILPWQWIGDNTPVGIVQFAWRLNAYATLAFAAAFSLLIPKTAKHAPKVLGIVLAAFLVMAVGLHCVNIYLERGINTETAPIKEADIGTWSSKNADYAPLRSKEWLDTHWKTMRVIYMGDEKIPRTPEIEGSGTRYIQSIETAEDDMQADIPVFRYYGQTVLLNGEAATAEMSQRGTTLTDIPKAGTSVIEISYRYTAAARAAWAFSAIVLLSAVAYALCRRKTDNP